MRAIGEEHGYYRGIDSVELNFVSDYYTNLGYKQYQLALDIASDMEEICPEAALLQLANPVFEVTTLLHRERSKIKAVGFCDEYIGVYPLMQVVGLDPSETEFQVAGVNHCIWLTKLRNKLTGENVYPVIDSWIKDGARQFWNNHNLGLWEETISPAAVDMYRLYGLYPIGDTARSFTWKYHYDLETAKKWFGPLGGTDSEIGLQVRLDRFQANAERMIRLANDPRAILTNHIAPKKGKDEFSDFIDATTLGEEKRLVLNIPNDSLLAQLSNDLSVELPVVVSKDGKLSPEKVEPFPRRLLDFVILPRVNRANWGLEAFVSGSREMLVEILIRDRRTRSEKQARDVIDAILSMPENQDMARHYR